MLKEDNLERLDRNIRLFGAEGQDRIRQSSVAVIGAGGLGTHVIQQLAYLGVGKLRFVDHEDLDESNKNRYVSAYYDDKVPGSPKVSVAARMVHLIDPSIHVTRVHDQLRSRAAFKAVIESDFVFGCLDNDGARLVLNELCAAYRRPYIDLATEIIVGSPPLYGGRVCYAANGDGCLVCLRQIDFREAREDLEHEQSKIDRMNLYGVPKNELNERGPSVVSINGVIASLGVTEFAGIASGLRKGHRLLIYRGDLGRVTRGVDEPVANCYYCKEVHGLQHAADVERYIRLSEPPSEVPRLP